MFESLSGVLPFAHGETDHFKIGHAVGDPAVLAQPLEELVEDVRGVTEGMRALVAKALQKDLSQRFGSAVEMRKTLHTMSKLQDYKTFGLFISYRAWCEKLFAEALYRAASACELQQQPGRQNRMAVYLDTVCIVDGQRFDVNFAKGLANSTVFAPLLSASCLKNFVELGQEDKEDFVLAEWIMALELQSQGIVKAIFPIVIGDGLQGSRSFVKALRDSSPISWPASEGSHEAGSGAIPNVVSVKSTAKARECLGKNLLGLPRLI
jgi:hypothetical protein